jgi:hypothetical protein
MTEIPELAVGEAVAVDWTFEEYLEDRSALTRSSLAFCEKDPRGFREWALGQASSGSESKSKTRGTNTHLWLLEPQEWSRRVGVPEIPRPEGASGNAKKGSRAREIYDSWCAVVAQREALMSKIPDRVDVTLAEFEKIQAIAKSVWSHPDALALLCAPGWVEQTVLWREPTTGLLTKVRLDRLDELGPEHIVETELEVGLAIVDIKTTRDHTPRAFGRSIAEYGYLPQAAFYSDAVEALIGRKPTFYFIAAKNESNWGTAVYRLDEEQLERGRQTYQDRLLDVLGRQFRDDWLADCERGVQYLPVPDWKTR